MKQPGRSLGSVLVAGLWGAIWWATAWGQSNDPRNQGPSALENERRTYDGTGEVREDDPATSRSFYIYYRAGMCGLFYSTTAEYIYAANNHNIKVTVGYHMVPPFLRRGLRYHTLPYYHTILLSYYPTILISYYPTILLSYYPTIILPYYPTIIPARVTLYLTGRNTLGE